MAFLAAALGYIFEGKFFIVFIVRLWSETVLLTAGFSGLAVVSRYVNEPRAPIGLLCLCYYD